MHYVVVPGINGSGSGHWQTHWQDGWGTSSSRIAPASWDEPDPEDWCHALELAVRPYQQADVVLVAHSLGCLAAAFWLRRARPGVRGVLLVAPPDVSGPAFPRAAAPGFVSLGVAPVRVPGLVVSSDDDPYCSAGAASALAAAWGAGHVSIGPAGHINALGDWRHGRELLTAFTAGLGAG